MKQRWIITLLLPALLAGGTPVAASGPAPATAPAQRVGDGPARASFPYAAAGLTPREAAAHLLNRFTFGPRPGQVDAVLAEGLEAWFDRQLAADLPEDDLRRRLVGFHTLGMSATELAETYANIGVVLLQAQEAGKLSAETIAEGPAGKASRGRSRSMSSDMSSDRSMRQAREERQRKLRDFAREEGYRPIRELIREQTAQKLVRAVYAENQLREVLVDFWTNHFAVSLVDPETRAFGLSYERDAIRPRTLTTFRELLGASAKHPAMLVYLDNARSSAEANRRTTIDAKLRQLRRAERRQRARIQRGEEPRRFRPRRDLVIDPRDASLARRGRKAEEMGLNENYARELLELHTLGVDGGFTQRDVVEVARAMTGWTTLPPGKKSPQLVQRIERARHAGYLGFVFEEDGFIFRADTHDAEAKTVLGKRLPAGRGIEDGEEVLDLLADHPSTARHLAYKLAVRFVSDDPPAALVDRLATVFRRTRGDVPSLLRTLVESPEFWAREAVAAKIKTPFELATSALRGLDAEVDDVRNTARWLTRMGQRLYAPQAPTGFPETARPWVNAGALIHRMNFGLELVTDRVAGVEVDLAALNDGKEPSSRLDALGIYLNLLLPGRAHQATLLRLQPVVRSPELAGRVAEASREQGGAAFGVRDFSARRRGENGSASESIASGMGPHLMGGGSDRVQIGKRRGAARRRSFDKRRAPSALEQVVGVILGSPEFQRR